jgi:hypothetical protein
VQAVTREAIHCITSKQAHRCASCRPTRYGKDKEQSPFRGFDLGGLRSLTRIAGAEQPHFDREAVRLVAPGIVFPACINFTTRPTLQELPPGGHSKDTPAISP